MSFKTDEYGLIGFPLTHSFSQRYFNEKFKSEKIDAVYLNFQLSDIGELMEMLSEHPRLQGFNVTLPYKEHIIPYLDEIDPKAKEIGAVNVVKIQHLPGGRYKTQRIQQRLYRISRLNCSASERGSSFCTCTWHWRCI